MDIVMQNGDVATSLSDGSYFGEICLLTNARRVARYVPCWSSSSSDIPQVISNEIRNYILYYIDTHILSMRDDEFKFANLSLHFPIVPSANSKCSKCA